MPRRSHADTLVRWRRLIESVAQAEDDPELQDVRPFRVQLEEMYRQAFELAQKRAALEAQKQAATRELGELLESGSKTATWIRAWLREHVGHESERLAAFDIKPARKGGRPRKKKPSPEG